MFIKKWVLTSTAFKRPNIRFIPRGISQRDGHISQPAQMADTANGRTLRHFQEPGFGPGEQFSERRGMERLARAEILFVGGCE